VEPSTKPCMPFGAGGGGVIRRRQVNKNSQQRNMQSSSSSSTSTSTMHQVSSALEQIQVQESQAQVTVSLPRGARSRAQSLPRGHQVTHEESSFRVSLPSSARTSRQASAEPEAKRKLTRHGSVEIYDGSYSLKVSSQQSQQPGVSSLQQTKGDHIRIVGESEVDSDTGAGVETNVSSVSSGRTGHIQQSHQTEQSEAIVSRVQQSSQQSSQQSCIQQSSVQQSSVQQSSQQQSCVQQQQSSSSVTEQTTFRESCTSSTSTSIQQQTSTTSHESIQQSSHYSSEESQSSHHISQPPIAAPSQERAAITQSGGKYQLSSGLRRSRHTSGSGDQRQGPGSVLKGLDTKLEEIAKAQKEEGGQAYVAKVSSRQTSRRPSVSGQQEVTTVTLSLPPSQRGSRHSSRRGSVSEGGTGTRRSRRGSLDIYTAEYAIKIGGGTGKGKPGITGMEQKTAFHMKVENEADSDLSLCGRCHLPTHKTKVCPEFGSLSCPRCLDWEHWEDSCWAGDTQPHVCNRCQYEGHSEIVHDAGDYKQRRAIVDALGWEPFQEWFYDTNFRGWWQVTGCVGVPLYRIYPRKTEWRTERPDPGPDTETQPKCGLSRVDSVDDMIAQVKLLNQRRPLPKKDEDDSSGRSSPGYIKQDTDTVSSNRKSRTFSETLKTLDADIVAELDVK